METKLKGIVEVIYNDLLDTLPTELEIEEKFNNHEIDCSMVVAKRDAASLESSIQIRPNNALHGTVDVLEPVLKVHKLHPIRDSLVREFAPHINYGDLATLIMGNAEEGRFSSYLAFDISHIPKGIEVENAKLVLYSIKDINLEYFMTVFETDNDWAEMAIRWGNRPLLGSRITRFVTPKKSGKFEVDLTEYVRSWYESKDAVRSFAIEPLNHSIIEVIYLSSRESSTPPILKISYYDIPDNPGSFRLDAEMTVAVNINRDLSCEIEVMSNLRGGDIDAEIELIQKDNKLELDTEIVVGISEEDSVGSTIELESKEQETQIDAELWVSQSILLDSEIELIATESTSDLESVFILAVDDFLDLDSEIQLIHKKVSLELDAEITAALHEISLLDVEINLFRKEHDTDLNSEIILAIWNKSELMSDIELINKESSVDLASEMFVRSYGDDSLDTVIQLDEKESFTEIGVEFFARSYGEGDIDLEIELEEKEFFNEITAEMDMVPKTSVVALDSNMTVRVFWAEDLHASITIERRFELDVLITLENKYSDKELVCEIFVDDGGDYAFII